jgi:hypothetical protein
MDITEGAHDLTIACPKCNRKVHFPIEISGELKANRLTGEKLTPMFSKKSQEHTCNGESQPEMDFEGDE